MSDYNKRDLDHPVAGGADGEPSNEPSQGTEPPLGSKGNGSAARRFGIWLRIKNLVTVEWFFRTFVPRTKNVLEIVAILAAGWWAYTRFDVVQAPSLAHRADVQGELEWWSPPSG